MTTETGDWAACPAGEYVTGGVDAASSPIFDLMETGRELLILSACGQLDAPEWLPAGSVEGDDGEISLYRRG